MKIADKTFDMDSAGRLMRPGNSRVTRCTNLRLDSSGALAPVHSPRSLAALAGWEPLCTLATPDGERLLLRRSAAAALLEGDEIHELEGVTTRPLCAVAGDGGFILMTESGPLRYDSEGTLLSAPSSPTHTPVLRAVQEVTVGAHVQAIHFPEGYTGTETELLPDDLDELTANLLRGYTEAVLAESLAGRAVQPLLARVKLVDAAGRVVSVSPPTLLQPQAGWSGMAPAELTVTRGTDSRLHFCASGTVTLRSYAIALECPGEAAAASCPSAVAAQVWVSPQVHPMEPRGTAEYRWVNGETPAATLQAWLPGASMGHSPATALWESRLERLLARLDDCETLLGVVENPYGGTARSCIVSAGSVTPTFVTSPAESCKTVTALLARSVTKADLETTMAARLSAPHSFSAGCCCVSGDKVLWGDLRERPFRGSAWATMCSGEPLGDVAWASVKVTLRRPDGTLRSVCRTDFGATPGIYAGPLLCYPDPGAIKMEVRVALIDGRGASAAWTLIPDEGARLAYRRLPAGTALTFTEGAALSPFEESTSGSDTLLPGAVASAERDSPLDVIRAGTVAEGRVTALTPAWGAGSSWDYAGGRFYAFATTGIHAVSLGASGRLLRASLIDNRSCPLSRCAALTPGGVAVLAGSDLVVLSGTRSATLMQGIGAAHALGYDPERHEIWVVRAADILVWQMRHDGYHTRATAGAGTPVTTTRSLLITIDDTLLTTANATAAPETEVEWRGVTRGAQFTGAPQAKLLTVDLRGTVGSGTLTVADCAGSPLTTLRLSGRAARPAAVKLVGPRRSGGTLTLQARVGDDFRLLDLRL